MAISEIDPSRAFLQLIPGDIIETQDGKRYVFQERKRTRFIALNQATQQLYTIPNTHFARKIGHVDAQPDQQRLITPWTALKRGDLFIVDDGRRLTLYRFVKATDTPRIIGAHPRKPPYETSIPVSLYAGTVEDFLR